MEMSNRPGAEAESLLRPEYRGRVVTGASAPAWESGEGERAPFLRPEPVKLTPAWEGSNLPNDTLNLKGIAMDLAPPKDRYNLILWTMAVNGLGTLTAWNMFITAKTYFTDYKLKDSPYRDSFLVYLGVASQLPNFLFSWFNVFVEMGGDLTVRIVWSLCLEVAIFVVTIIMAMVDTSDVPAVFFWITMISVFVLNALNAIFQNSVYGVAAKLPPKYTGAVITGSNLAGCIIVFISWLSQAVGGSPRTSAIYYFIGGIFVLLVCFDTYFALPLNRFYRYHNSLEQRTYRTNPALAATEPRDRPKTPYLLLLKQTWVQLYNVFITFGVTLACFPAVHSDIQSVQGAGSPLGKDFVLLTCFLTFNVTATLGNITAGFWQFPSRNWLFIFTTLRIAFIPLFLLCNYQPMGAPRTLAVLIDSDTVYWIIAVVFGWSHGQASALSMMYVSGNVAPEHASKAGMIGAAMLISGILFGILFSSVCAQIVRLAVWAHT